MICRSNIPQKVLHDKRLSAIEKIAYGAIYGFEERDKIAHFSNAALVEPLGVSVRTIERIINKLVTLNYISVEGTQRKRVLRIILEPIPYPDERVFGVALSTTPKTRSDLSTTSGVMSATSGAASATSGVNLTTSYNKDLNKEENIYTGQESDLDSSESKQEEKPQTPLEAHKDPFFESFMQTYGEGMPKERESILRAILGEFDISQEAREGRHFVNGGHLPLKKYPDIFLKPQDALDVHDQYIDAGIQKKDMKRAFKAVQDYLSGKPEYQKTRAYAHLIGWAKKQVLEHLISETRLKKENAYLETAKG
jgi:hypothetical protein